MKRALKLLVTLALGATTLVSLGTAPATASTMTGGVEAPAVLSAYAYSALGANGGRTLIVAKVRTSVVSCQLKLASVSGGPMPVVYASNVRYCHVNFYAYVTVGANTTGNYRSIAFEVISRNILGQSSVGMVYLDVAPEGSDYKAPPPPVVNTNPAQPPVAPAKPVVKKATVLNSWMGFDDTTSGNWSGYEVLGSRITSVHGTFTVPELDNNETCTSNMSEWVGIDGGGIPGADTNLIQAGIIETPYNEDGACQAPGYYTIQPWWEVLPATATNIDSIVAHFGDSVSVSIWEDSPGSYWWTISVTDNTNGESFQTTQPYYGAGNSAEWVTESMHDSVNCSGQCTLTQYSPRVTFSGLGYDTQDPPYEADAISMDQGYGVVSAPSYVTNIGQLLAQGFTTTYTGATGF